MDFVNEIRDTGRVLKERGQMLYNISIELSLKGLCGTDPDFYYYGLESEQALLMLEYWERQQHTNKDALEI